MCIDVFALRWLVGTETCSDSELEKFNAFVRGLTEDSDSSSGLEVFLWRPSSVRSPRERFAS